MAEKVWHNHIVKQGEGGAPDLLYVDLHLVHEAMSPQAFEGLRLAGREVCHPELTVAAGDHNTPTFDIDLPIAGETNCLQIGTLRENTRELGVRLHSFGDADQRIVHVVDPQLGLTQPGMTVVCGDSRTSTHDTFEALAFGIGTSQVEHVLVTRALPLAPLKAAAITVNDSPSQGSTVKDIIPTVITRIGTGGGQGHILECRGQAIRELSMEERMMVCNMSIGADTQAGVVIPDETTFEYLKDRPHAPEGEGWERAVEYWKTLPSDEDAVFDTEVIPKTVDIEPFVTWDTNPGQGVPLSSKVPGPEGFSDESQRPATEGVLEYADLKVGTAARDIHIDTVFLGSCMNGHIEDLRTAAVIIKRREKAGSIRALVVPGSAQVRLQAEVEGLDRVSTEFGAE